MKLKPIQDQVVVIVGATSGIGLSTAREFARLGAKVVISGRDTQALNSAASEIRQQGGEVTGVEVQDVANYEQLRRLADQAFQTYGRIDTWVHSAAVAVYARFEETQPEEFRRVMEVNLLGQIYGALAALPYMKREGRGALIHVSSIEAKRSVPYHAAYAASKHGIPGFLDSLRLELRQEGVPISVTNIMPGSINTPLFEKSLTRLGVTPKGKPPVYEPEVAARAIIYAATHPVREMYVGGSARQMAVMQKIAPGPMDRLLSRIGFRPQRTDIPESPDSPNNLYHHIPGYDRERGSIQQGKPYSMWTWLRTHPAVRWALTGSALAGSAFYFGRRYMLRNDLTTRELIEQARIFGKEAPGKVAGQAAYLKHEYGPRLAQVPHQVRHRVSSLHMPRQIGPVKFRRRVGPVVLPGKIGPVRLPGRIGPMTIPARIGPVPVPAKVGPVTIPEKLGPYALPVMLAGALSFGAWMALRKK